MSLPVSFCLRPKRALDESKGSFINTIEGTLLLLRHPLPPLIPLANEYHSSPAPPPPKQPEMSDRARNSILTRARHERALGLRRRFTGAGQNRKRGCSCGHIPPSSRDTLCIFKTPPLSWRRRSSYSDCSIARLMVSHGILTCLFSAFLPLHYDHITCNTSFSSHALPPS